MKKNFPLYIAKRYLFSKSSTNAINVITIIAAIGVVIGSASLLIVLSGFAGLKDYSLQFSSLVDPDLKVLPSEGKSLVITPETISKLDQIEGIASFSKIIEERAILVSDNKRQIVTIKGVDENFPQNSVESITSLGSWFLPDMNQIVSGWGVASNLSFSIMDYGKVLKLFTPKPGKGQITSEADAFNSISVVNTGVFEINENLDNSLVYTHVGVAQKLLKYDNSTFSGIEIIAKNTENLADIQEQLRVVFGETVVIKNKAQLNDALHKMLNTENLAVYLIFTLVLIIALFNVVGSIVMMILDKKKNLKTLYNIGVTIKDIKRIFFLQGSLMSVLGGIIGILFAIILIMLQLSFGWFKITASLAYPVSLNSVNVFVVFITITVLGIIASKIASSRISKSLIE